MNDGKKETEKGEIKNKLSNGRNKSFESVCGGGRQVEKK
jgi:hypothetical protein